MTDLERRIRDALDDQARSTPPPHEAQSALRRTRRRQALTIGGGALGALALVVGTVVGVMTVMNPDGRGDGLPATPSTVTTTINGVSITHPEAWYVFDPDDEGLNGPTGASGLPSLPRLVLAAYPSGLDEMFACPGMAEQPSATFAMTIQEGPLALAGDAAAPWPVEQIPLGVDPLSEDSCYPGWELFGAEWTAAGRSFQARIGFASEVSDEDRQALLAAFESMTFEPAAEPATSVVLATGTAGGESWELIAERQADELVLSVQGESFGAGGGGFDPARLTVNGHVFGAGNDAQLLLYGAVPADAVRLGIRFGLGDESPIDVLDVPDSINPDMNAFVATLPDGADATVSAYDTNGDEVYTARFMSGGEEPVGTPPPTLPDEVLPEHGGRYWGLYLAIGETAQDSQIVQAMMDVEELGYTPSTGDIACDDGAIDGLGATPVVTTRVAVYFASRADAMVAFRGAHELLGVEPAGIARVTTYCLD